MTFNSEIFIIISPIFILLGSLTYYLLKKRRKSAKRIYKLIDELEKKYIY